MSDVLQERKPIPLLCRLFGHKWTTIDRYEDGWRFQICFRPRAFWLRSCLSQRGTDHG